MSDLSRKVISNIEEQHLQPKPRWRFLWENGLIWGLFGLSVVLGSIAVAIVLYYIFDYDAAVYAHLLQRSKWFFLIEDIPYIWIAVTLLFMGVAYYYFQHTKHGYKYGFYKIILGSLLLSMIGGGLVYAISDIPEYVDGLAAKNLPFYEQILMTRNKRWMHPEHGLLGGRIEQVEVRELLLQDFQGKMWQVDIQDAQRPPRLRSGVLIRVLGDPVDESHFKAFVIQPWLLKRKPAENGVFQELLRKKLPPPENKPLF